MSDLIKKIDYKVDRRLGNTIAFIVVSFSLTLCLIFILWGVGITSNMSPAEITTQDWTIVPVSEGTDIDFEIVPQSGVKPHYTVMVNGDNNRKAHFPGSNSINLGNGATNLWFSLDGDDGLRKAIIIIRKK